MSLSLQYSYLHLLVHLQPLPTPSCPPLTDWSWPSSIPFNANYTYPGKLPPASTHNPQKQEGRHRTLLPAETRRSDSTFQVANELQPDLFYLLGVFISLGPVCCSRGTKRQEKKPKQQARQGLLKNKHSLQEGESASSADHNPSEPKERQLAHGIKVQTNRGLHLVWGRLSPSPSVFPWIYPCSHQKHEFLHLVLSLEIGWGTERFVLGPKEKTNGQRDIPAFL